MQSYCGMESTNLTEKQKEFCREYVASGYNATQAYKIVYDVLEESARRAGSRLLTNVDILEFIKELKEKKEETTNTSFVQVVNEFQSIIKSPNSELKDKIRSLENLCKMFGYYAPEKTESDFTIKNPIIRVGYGISND